MNRSRSIPGIQILVCPLSWEYNSWRPHQYIPQPTGIGRNGHQQTRTDPRPPGPSRGSGGFHPDLGNPDNSGSIPQYDRRSLRRGGHRRPDRRTPLGVIEHVPTRRRAEPILRPPDRPGRCRGDPVAARRRVPPCRDHAGPPRRPDRPRRRPAGARRHLGGRCRAGRHPLDPVPRPGRAVAAPRAGRAATAPEGGPAGPPRRGDRGLSGPSPSRSAAGRPWAWSPGSGP